MLAPKKMVSHGVRCLIDSENIFNAIEYATRALEQGSEDIALGEIEKAKEKLEEMQDIVGRFIYYNFSRWAKGCATEENMQAWYQKWYLIKVKKNGSKEEIINNFRENFSVCRI